MSQYTVARIANVLTDQYRDLIDMSDWKGRPEDQVRGAFLSRSLAALCIKSLANVDAQTATAAITDRYHDGGLDAVYFDSKTDTLFLVQAKWSETGSKPPTEQMANKFVAGIRDLLAARFDRFNDLIQAKSAEIRAVLYSEREIHLRLIVAHTAAQPTPAYVTRKIEELVEELNDPVAVAKYDEFGQAGIYELITSESRDPKIKLQIALNDFGVIDRPFLAYYGRVHISAVAEWWKTYRNRLFTENLRLYYVNSNVNEALRKTIASEPDNFWYFNNGITVICDNITRSVAGAPGTKLGLFNCDGVSIVNGAQTVGTIGSAYELGRVQTADPESPMSYVQVRIISLEKCPPAFARQITRAANLQNAVGNREFAAMDPLQHRLATEFALDRRKYVYKSGEQDPRGEEGCSIVEATQALSCAASVGLAVQVKREIGGVWADTEGPPYTDIFNEDLTSRKVWRAVSVMRAVEEDLNRLRRSEAPRADLVGVHMHRIILHLVFQDPDVRRWYTDPDGEEQLIACTRSAAERVFQKVAAYLEVNHPGEYLANFAKNAPKCEDLVRAFNAPIQTTDMWTQTQLI